MIIVVAHRISNPEAFWAAAARELPNLPAGIRIHGNFPDASGARATCLWEAESVDTLRAYLEDKTGAFAENDYMAVDASKAMGLPAH